MIEKFMTAIDKTAVLKRLLFAIIFILTSISSVFAQHDLVFQHLSISNGLYQSSVNAITQVESSLLWFSAWDGLKKYDGEGFTVYKNNIKNACRISSNEVGNLLFDKAGNPCFKPHNGKMYVDSLLGITSFDPDNMNANQYVAPWRTWWAFLFYGMVISVLLYLFVRIILSRSRFKHQLELEQVKSERQKSLNLMNLRFFTDISHEFRNPLVLVLGPLEQIIADYRGSNELYKQLLVVEKNAKRMMKLIDQLMDFRKYEDNHFKLIADEGNIVKFVKEIFLSFKQYARLRHFNYEFTTEVDVITIWYDRDKMERVIYNLLSNAFKYTPENGTINVSIRQKSEDVEIRVEDNGIGMDHEHLVKIFDRFYEIEDKGSPISTKNNKGTGIGLALAKGIVDLHSGKIWAESAKKRGSVFTVRLPLGNDHLKEDQIIKDDRNREDIANYNVELEWTDQLEEKYLIPELPKNAPQVLIAEDNDEVRRFMVQVFKDQYNILEASNGNEGFRLALQSDPDIIISDIMMPDMDGIEFCSQVKSNSKTSHIPFILLTARTSFAFKFEGLEMGADDYISKPFHVKELKMKVRNLINSQRKLKEKFAAGSIVKPGDITVNSMNEKLLEKALQIVDDNISNELFDIPTFCEELGVSRTMLFTRIKAWTNLTPNEFIQTMRMKRAAQLLEQNKLNIAQVGFRVGFRNPKYFSKCFQRHYEVTPTWYAQKFSNPEVVEVIGH